MRPRAAPRLHLQEPPRLPCLPPATSLRHRQLDRRNPLRAPFSLQKITWKEETATVIYRSGHNWKTKRNFEVFSATDFIAAAVESRPLSPSSLRPTTSDGNRKPPIPLRSNSRPLTGHRTSNSKSGSKPLNHRNPPHPGQQRNSPSTPTAPSSSTPILRLKTNSLNSSTTEPAGTGERQPKILSFALRLPTRTRTSTFMDHGEAPHFSRSLRKMPRFLASPPALRLTIPIARRTTAQPRLGRHPLGESHHRNHPARTLEMRCIGENQRAPSLHPNVHQLPASGAMGEGLPKDSSHTRPLLKAKHRDRVRLPSK